jgi:hypothetical protein
MKAVAILVLVGAVMLNSCGGNSATVQAASGTVWQAQLSGGSGAASGLSFITTFTINGNGSLTVPSSDFQFLNQGSCFPVTGDDASGSITDLQVNPTTGEVTANFSFTVTGAGNTLTLTGPLTGTETGIVVGTTNTGTFSSASVLGTWTLTGSPTCSVTSTDETSFTMTLCTSATSCTTP